MKTKLKQSVLAVAVATVGLLPLAAPAYALSTVAQAQANAQQARLSDIKSRGDAEINRRLNTLSTLSGKISGLAKVSASDKTSLTSEVDSEVSGLTALKTKLDAETTVDGAGTDAKSIISDYRVYALIVPKVWLIRTADDQQAVQTKLTALSAKLQSRITTAKNSGKDVTGLQNSLDDLNSQVSTGQAISGSVETKALALQPSDYNSDHTVVSGYRSQLQTAHSDDQKAISDAKSIVAGLKNL